MNTKARKMIEKIRLEKYLYYCEICGGSFFLAPAHRKKRRFYHTAEELADYNEWVWICQKCHKKIEFNRKATDEVFDRLRP